MSMQRSINVYNNNVGKKKKKKKKNVGALTRIGGSCDLVQSRRSLHLLIFKKKIRPITQIADVCRLDIC
jgi:hypothetical protein